MPLPSQQLIFAWLAELELLMSGLWGSVWSVSFKLAIDNRTRTHNAKTVPCNSNSGNISSSKCNILSVLACLRRPHSSQRFIYHLSFRLPFDIDRLSQDGQSLRLQHVYLVIFGAVTWSALGLSGRPTLCCSRTSAATWWLGEIQVDVLNRINLWASTNATILTASGGGVVRGVVTEEGGVYGYIYPKISPSKLFMG